MSALPMPRRATRPSTATTSVCSPPSRASTFRTQPLTDPSRRPHQTQSGQPKCRKSTMADGFLVRPEDIRLDRDEIAAGAFLTRYREPTRSLYTLNLRQWFQFCADHGIAPLTASRAHIEVWARELEERHGLKVSTVANKLNTVAGFYKLAYIDRVIPENPAEYLRRPTVPPVSSRQSLTRAEALICLDLAQKSHP